MSGLVLKDLVLIKLKIMNKIINNSLIDSFSSMKTLNYDDLVDLFCKIIFVKDLFLWNN